MTNPVLREAARDDVPAVLRLLADDFIGHSRGAQADEHAYGAFEEIARDPNNILYVLDDDGAVVGCAQLTLIPGLSRRGMRRAQIESVRVASDRRGQGLGQRMMREFIAIARAKGCGMVQLATDKRRVDAHRFYEALGFEDTHKGFKLAL
jgi:ribosomal protein S18 acetylase RimI-like enzyme